MDNFFYCAAQNCSHCHQVSASIWHMWSNVTFNRQVLMVCCILLLDKQWYKPRMQKPNFLTYWGQNEGKKRLQGDEHGHGWIINCICNEKEQNLKDSLSAVLSQWPFLKVSLALSKNAQSGRNWHPRQSSCNVNNRRLSTNDVLHFWSQRLSAGGWESIFLSDKIPVKS